MDQAGRSRNIWHSAAFHRIPEARQMNHVLSILFATAFTYFVCLLAGKALLKMLRVRLYRSEEYFFGFVAGSVCLTTIVFWLAAAGLAYRSVFLGTGVVLMISAIAYGGARFSREWISPQ